MCTRARDTTPSNPVSLRLSSQSVACISRYIARPLQHISSSQMLDGTSKLQWPSSSMSTQFVIHNYPAIPLMFSALWKWLKWTKITFQTEHQVHKVRTWQSTLKHTERRSTRIYEMSDCKHDCRPTRRSFSRFPSVPPWQWRNGRTYLFLDRPRVLSRQPLPICNHCTSHLTLHNICCWN
jgi:hypothetical protein